MSAIGDERTERLDIIPAKTKVIEHIQLKYACKSCSAEKIGFFQMVLKAQKRQLIFLA